MLTDGLRALAIADPAIYALCGDRIAPPPAPEDLSQYPYVTYSRVSYASDYATDGPVSFSTARIVYECFAIRKADANALGEAFRLCFSGYRGVLNEGTPVDSIEIANVSDAWNPARVYSVQVHAMVNFSEAKNH